MLQSFSGACDRSPDDQLTANFLSIFHEHSISGYFRYLCKDIAFVKIKSSGNILISNVDFFTTLASLTLLDG
jgi:hypothetical protein